MEGRVDMMQDLVREALIRKHPEDEKKAVFLAGAAEGEVGQCALLLDLGVDIDSAHEEGNMMALMVAVINDHVDVVELLVDRGANVSIKNSEWKTALDLAKESNCNEYIQTLVVLKMQELRWTRGFSFRWEHEEDVDMMRPEESGR
ncbi:hypothetical protein HK102_001758 [Quaeritorhiza haematococci]|nr:hypothetical protein HK102_001758 [Quaeritorhiza haematococci]